MNKRLKKLLSLSLVGLLSLSMAVPVSAEETKEEAEAKIQELEQEKKDLESKLSDLKENRTSTEQYIEELDGQLTDVTEQIADISKQLEEIEGKIVDTEELLEEARAKEERQYELLKLRIKTMYERGETSYMEVLLKLKDVSSALNNSEYISKISDFDNNLLQNLQTTKQEIADYEVELEGEKAEQEAKMSELEVKHEEIADIAAAKHEELQTLNGDIDSAEGKISDIQEDINNEEEVIAAINAAAAAAQAEYERLQALAYQTVVTVDPEAQAEAERAQAEADRLAQERAEAEAAAEAARREAEAAEDEAQREAAEQAAAQAEAEAAARREEAERAQAEADQAQANADASATTTTTGGLTTGTGSFIWPLPGISNITSYFGGRICPFHGPENHDGIDIAAPGGTPVLAADAGVVTKVEYHYSLGNYVVINHGNGYSTWYLHNSAVAVSVGQNVSRGQVVSYVGMTGSATGDHLDFRIMTDDGSYLNPLNFVSP